MKIIPLVWLLVLSFSAPRASAQSSTQIEPIPVTEPVPAVKHHVFDKKLIILTAVSIGVSIATSSTINRCRHDHGIGPCSDGGYGEFKAREVLRQVQTGFLVLPTFKIKKIEDDRQSKHKFWWLIEAGKPGVGILKQYVDMLPKYLTRRFISAQVTGQLSGLVG